MLPLSRKFFVDQIKHTPQNNFVAYTAPYGQKNDRFAMCYNAGLGSTFAQIFGVRNTVQIPEMIKKWSTLGHGWHTDEKVLTACIFNWNKQFRRVTFLNNDCRRGRIPHKQHKKYSETITKERPLTLLYSKERLLAGEYKDVPLPRPYQKYKAEVDTLFKLAMAQVETEKTKE